MVEEPIAGQFGCLSQRARFLEQMGGAGYDCETVLAAHAALGLPVEVECDVVVSGAPGPRKRVMALCDLVPGLRAIDGGPLANARIVESLSALLIGLNVRYKVSEGLGIRFTGLPEA